MSDEPLPTPQPPLPAPALVLVDGLTREQVLTAVGDARESGAPLDLEGHGSSGVAVLSLAVHQRRLGLRIEQVACLGARGEDDPVSGQALVVPPRPSQVSTRIVLMASQDPESIAWTDRTEAELAAAGWSVDRAG
ncbi:hypothetical protein [Nocardioides stalactiti]|uniref:hypothetical protein n=1 Tax=Nocardioides stalactiti TaxID=2755356 RepID=UPI0016004E6E|nr:hypothetical protein [Nocardioides stalactiti]